MQKIQEDLKSGDKVVSIFGDPQNPYDIGVIESINQKDNKAEVVFYGNLKVEFDIKDIKKVEKPPSDLVSMEKV